MTTQIERGLAVLEHLARHPEGAPVSEIAATLSLPLSATHRLLAELVKSGYVRQLRGQGDYGLTIKLVALGLGYLGASGVIDVAQPALDKLAQTAGELVRLAIIDGEDLVFVAKAQGATRGLRYDPDMGLAVCLSCSAAGHAWLSTLDDDTAVQKVARQGLGAPSDYGPKAPTTVKALMAFVHAARQRGYATIHEVFAPAMSAMAAPVLVHGSAVGVVTIAGPAVRLDATRMQQLGPAVLDTAQELAALSAASTLLRRKTQAPG
jgi:DNA-binding IclR family transcriptional regulator